MWLVLLCSHIQLSLFGPHCRGLGTVEDLTQLSSLVPISSEQAEEAEKEDLRVQLKRHHPSSPLSGSKASKRPKIKVSLISQGDPAGGPCTPSPGGTPEGEFPLTCSVNWLSSPGLIALPSWGCLLALSLNCSARAA